MRAIIVENEKDAQELLSSILNNFIPEVELVGISATVKEGVGLIRSKVPELLFLDIDLDDGTGFELLEKCADLKFKVIFTTAFDDYAIQAFNYETIAYILKPYGVAEVRKAIQKLFSMTSPNMDNQAIIKVIQTMQKTRDKKIPVYTHKGITLYDPSNIIDIEGEGSYSCLYTVDGKKAIISKTLGDFEKELPANFFRVHKSHIINVDHVEKYIREDGGYVLLDSGRKIAVSRRKKEEFISFLTSQ